jgi:uncharacterized protein (DUF302 family)
MLLTADTNRSVEQVRELMPEVAKKHGFGVLGVHDLRATLREKGQEFDRAVLVFDVCNPVQAKKVLTAAPQVSCVLPCRVSVFERDGGSRLVTVQPTRMMGMFDTPELADVAHDVEESMRAILDEFEG